MPRTIPVRIPTRDPPMPKEISKVRNPRSLPQGKGAPVVAKQHARLVGGYTGGTFRQHNPPPVAYLNQLVHTWSMPWAIRQRLVAPADKTNMFLSDPRGITGGVGTWDNKEDYFRNLSVRGLGRNPEQTNPERTPVGRAGGLRGKPYQPRGLTYRFLPSPDAVSVDKNDESIPLYKGH